MAKVITIKEGGISRKFNASRLLTNQQSQGSPPCGWIPEEDVELETLSVWENGRYEPRKYGFSEVYVNISASIQFIQGIEEDEFKIIAIDPIDGTIIEGIGLEEMPDLNEVPVIVGYDSNDDIHLITVDLDTGDYFDIALPDEWEHFADNVDNPNFIIGYDEQEETYVIVSPIDDGTLDFQEFPFDIVDSDGNVIQQADVPNVIDFDSDDGNDFVLGVDPETGDYAIATINPDTGIDVTNLPYDLDTFTPDDNGVIEGTDSDGNEVAIDVSDGSVINLPSSITIIVQPTKTEYQDGETIDPTGMVVVAKNADGTTWTSTEYPNGHIPLGELYIDPTLAIANSITSFGSSLMVEPPIYINTLNSYTLEGTGVNNSANPPTRTYYKQTCETSAEKTVVIKRESSDQYGYYAQCYLFFASENPIRVRYINSYGEVTNDTTFNNTTDKYSAGVDSPTNPTCYYGWANLSISSAEPITDVKYPVNTHYTFADPIPNQSRLRPQISWVIMFALQLGLGTGGGTTNLTWERPVDHKELKTELTISIV